MPKQDVALPEDVKKRVRQACYEYDEGQLLNDMPFIRRLLAEELKRARDAERKRALDLAMNYYINRPVESSIPVVISKEMYKRLLGGELDEALKKRVKEE